MTAAGIPGEAAMKKKKVRYVIGTAAVLGAAPALGLLTPAATAAAATPATPAGYSGKTVSLRPGILLAATSAAPVASFVPAASSAPAARSPSVAAAAGRTCSSPFVGNSAHKGKGANEFIGTAVYHSDTHCLTSVRGHLNHAQIGLDGRVRAYNGKKAVGQWYPGGDAFSSLFGGGSTFFSVSMAVTATRACEALVYSTDKAKVAYGPVCEVVY
jgi:hypothetical protein